MGKGKGASTQNSEIVQLGQVAHDDYGFVESPCSPCESQVAPDDPECFESPPASPGGSYSYPSPEYNTAKANGATREYAEIALEHYNKKHRTNYKVAEGVEDLYSRSFLHCAFWIHCNFRAAKPTKMPCLEGTSFTNATAAEESPSTELFFAELIIVRPNEFKVTCCCILKGGKAFPSCEDCDSNLKHPVNGFREGFCMPYSLRSRSRASG